MLGWLYELITDEFLVVSLPRVMVLQNRRLGMLYKVLQSICVTVAVLYCVNERAFEEQHDVDAWGVGLWHERRQAWMAPDPGTLPAHCKNTAAYTSKEDPTFKYKPTSCKASPNQQFQPVNGGKLFLPTFVDDNNVWAGSGDECGEAARKACSELSAEAVFEEAQGQCSCALSEQFLVLDAGEQSIRFVYGYEVDTSDGQRQQLRRGGILSSTALAGAGDQLEPQSITLVTQFKTPDGAACTFGGKTQWLQSEALGGITGTLNELLVCAGVTLDSDPATLMPGTLVAPSHLRTMGFKLELHVHLHQNLFGHLTCNVRVVATPITTVAYHNDVILSAFPKLGAIAHRLQRVHGVAVDVRVRGHVYTLTWYQVLRGLVDVLVVLSIPRMILYVIAMYMMGHVSQVHRSAVRTKLNIFSKFHSSIAKVLLAEVAFRGLVNDFTARFDDLGVVTPTILLRRLEDIFCHDLRKEEVTRMAAVVFTSMDKDHDVGIGCREFMQSITDDGDITIKMLTHFFHAKTGKRSERLRMILDDTTSRTLMMKKSVSRLFTPETELEEIHGCHDFNRKTTKLGKVSSSDTMGSDAEDFEEKLRQHEQHVAVNTPDHEKDAAQLHSLTERVGKHEKELQRLLDDGKSTKESLMRRMEDLEHSLMQALGLLKEALAAPDLGSRQSSLSIACHLQTPKAGVAQGTQASMESDHGNSSSWARSLIDAALSNSEGEPQCQGKSIPTAKQLLAHKQ